MAAPVDKPFRFYDNRQKYLMFVTTCGEKWSVIEHIDRELDTLRPAPPAIRVFDAGVGDGTVLSGVLRRLHRRFPTAPVLVVGKEISLEDVRLALDKVPDRLVEHPETVFVFTNLYYYEAAQLTTRSGAAVERRRLELSGDSSAEFEAQIKAIFSELGGLWGVRPSKKTGNPRYVTPTVLTVSRKDRAFTLDAVIPDQPADALEYDLVLAVQPYRARLSAERKIAYVLKPCAEALAPGGLLVGVQSTGNDPGLEIVRGVWPDEAPFETPGPLLTRDLLAALAPSGRRFEDATDQSDNLFRYHMHAMPAEISENIGTSTLLAAWNAAVYVAQIDDSRLNEAMASGAYLEVTQDVLARHGGLWFVDEKFVVRRVG